jgi:PAS domain S-box-containing protein
MFSDMQMDGRNRQRIFVTPSKDSENARDKEDATKAQAIFSMFDVLLDALIAINDEGIIQYCNSSFEKLTGYVAKELVSKNITVIMTEEYKRTHDAYLKTYLKTRTSKIIGYGRDVIFQKKDGSVSTVHLEVTEKLVGDKSYFFGTLKKPVDKVMKSVLQTEREVLDRLVVPAIIIDHKGTIHGFNAAASTLLNYQLIDVVGRNINLLMTGMDKQNHDNYLKRYVETGKSKIIGVGRKVVAQTKDGALKPVMLSVTEKIDGETRFFTGILQDPNAQ